MRQRNQGIDLLRILSMLMVVILHILSQGGVLAALPAPSPASFLGGLLNAACYCAVNCFGMISGYVSHTQTLSLEKAFTTWAQAAFYSVGITLLFLLVWPQTVTLRLLLISFFPVVFHRYWYFTAYFGLFFLIPFLNTLIEGLTERRAKQLLWVLALLLSVVPTLSAQDVFFTRAGYTLLWLCALFLMGGCLRRLGPQWGPSGGVCLAGYVACVLLTAVSRPLLRLLIDSGIVFFPEALLLSYTSPTILLAGGFLLLLFRQLPVRPGPARVIGFFAPPAFGVYLIHAHPLVWVYLLTDRFRGYASLPAPVCVLCVLATACGIFLCCALVDVVREKLARLVLPPVFRTVRRLFGRGQQTDNQ